MNKKKWFKAAAVRAIKTFCQTAASMMTVGQTVYEVDWIGILSVSGLAAIMSMLTSLAGIPEVEREKEEPEGES